MSRLDEATLADIQRDAEATARLVVEVRRLRGLVGELGEGHDRLCSRSDPAYQHVRCTCDYDVRQALRAAGGES